MDPVTVNPMNSSAPPAAHEGRAEATATQPFSLLPSLLNDSITAVQRHALEVARALARDGVPIFVAKADETGDFHYPRGWQNTLASPETVDSWRPGDALCAVMGVVCDGLDVDPRHDGRASLAGLLAAHAVPRSFGRAATPSGGSHDLIPRLRTGSRDAVAPGVDIKGGRDGEGDAGRGFLFIAPTERTSKVTGEVVAYRWEHEPDLDGIDEEEDAEEVDNLRHIVSQAMSRTGSPLRDAQDGDGLLGGHRGGIPEGERHGRLLSYAGSLRRRNLPLPEAEVLMRRRWEDCAQPPAARTPFSCQEALVVLADVYHRYPPGPVVGDVEVDGWDLPARNAPLDWFNLLEAEQVATQWLVEPLIEVGTSVALYSPPKVGKSLLMLDICAALAAGRSALGRPPGKPRRVLYLDAENSRADLRERLDALGYEAGDLDDRLVYLSFPMLPALDTAHGGRELLALLNQHRPDLVVLDTVSRFIVGDENDARTWDDLYRHALLLCKRRDIAVVRLDHAGKELGRGQRGSSAKSTDVDAVWRLEAVPRQNAVRLIREVTRNGHGEGRVLLYRAVHPLRHVPETQGAGDEPQGELDAKVVRLLRELARLEVPLHAGRGQASQALAANGVKHGTNDLAQAVKIRKDPFAYTTVFSAHLSNSLSEEREQEAS